MKRYGYLYEKVIDYDNIVAAMIEYDRRRPRRLRRGVDYRLAWEIKREMESDFSKIIGTPRIKIIKEYGKIRRLQIPCYKSSIAQIALWNVCGKFVERRIHTQSFSSRKGYGGQLAAAKCSRFLHTHVADARYFLYFDIRKFYQHIDRRIVMDRLATIFKDGRILAMFRAILESSDDGLPIGYPFSHALANLYLVPLYYLIRSVKFVAKAYVYMDNWIVFSRYKKPLHKAVALAMRWLTGVGCVIKGDWQVAPTASRGVRLCGYVISPHGVRLYRKNWLRTMRDFRRAVAGNIDACISMASRRGWLRFINREYSPCFTTEKGYLWQ